MTSSLGQPHSNYFISNNSISENPEDILKNSFLSEPESDTPFENDQLKLPSKFNPPMPSTLEHIYDILIDRILCHNPEFSKRNMTLAQYKAMTKLRENRNIVIKKADKGSNVVIQNRTDYIKEGLRQLGKYQFYRKVIMNLTSEHRKRVQSLIDDLFAKKEISEKMFLFLSRGGNRTSVFYMLPKIHKNKTPVPGRPIVSSCDCPTEKISMLIDIILQPFVLHTNSYIRDTSDFLSKVNGIELHPDDWLFTMDVMSLYTNIPHDEGIQAIQELLNSKRKNQLPTNDNTIKMLELVLKCNNFMFNNENYLQINAQLWALG